MSRFSFHRPLILTALSFALATGCSSPPASTPVATTGQETAPAAPAEQAPATIATAGFTGSADINGVPFANAEVKVYRPGQDAPVAIAKTDENGQFTITLGTVIAPGGANVVAPGGANVIAPGGANVIAPGGANVIAPGGANVIAPGGANVIAPGGANVIAPGGANVIAPGGANVIAPGGANVIAPGGANVIAPGGANVIAPGGANVIAPGGANLLTLGAPLKVTASRDGASLAAVAIAGVIAPGGANVIAPGGANVVAPGGANVVAAGGLNYRVAQAPPPVPGQAPDVRLSASTTLAVLALGDRLEGALKSAYRQDGTGVVPESVNTIVEAVATFTQTLSAALGTTSQTALVDAVTHALDADGHGTLPSAIQRQVAQAVQNFQPAFVSAAKKLGDGILTAIASGGTNPNTTETKSIDFGGVQAPAVVPTKTGGSGGGGTPLTTVALNVGGTLTVSSSSGNGTPIAAPMDYSAFVASPVSGDMPHFGATQVTINNEAFLLGGAVHAPLGLTYTQDIISGNVGASLTLNEESQGLVRLAAARAYASAVLVGVHVYLLGGRDDSTVLGSVESITTTDLSGRADGFDTEGQTLATPVFKAAAASVETTTATRVYLTGGVASVSGSETPVGTVQVSTESAGVLGSWAPSYALMTPRFGHVAFVTMAGGVPKYLYVIGGCTGSNSLATVEVAEIAADGTLVGGANAFQAATATSPDPVTGAPVTAPLTLGAGRGRHGMSAFVRNGQLYLLGGLQMTGGSEVPFEGADRAVIDPVTGKLGPFSTHAAELVNARGYYNIVISGNSDMWMVNGEASSGGIIPMAAEKAVLR